MSDTPRALTNQEMQERTAAVVAAMGVIRVQDALTILCNMTGQLIAAVSSNVPSKIKGNVSSVTENIRRAAIAKALHDDNKRRANE